MAVTEFIDPRYHYKANFQWENLKAKLFRRSRGPKEYLSAWVLERVVIEYSVNSTASIFTMKREDPFHKRPPCQLKSIFH